MRINTNIASLQAQEASSITNNKLTNSLEKLSTGLRINKASDDASGLAIADKLRTQASSIGQSIRNGNSAISLIRIADKAMGEQSNILDIVKTKLIQAGTSTTSKEGVKAISKDINKLLSQLDNIASQTNYNGITLLQGSNATQSGAELNFLMGEKATDLIKSAKGVLSNRNGLELGDLGKAVSGASPALSASSARTNLTKIDAALDKLNAWRSDFGSTQNQLESAVRNQMTQETNIRAAESIIRDVDYAKESATFNRQNIIAQAGTYAMSQANAIQQNVLRLLQ